MVRRTRVILALLRPLEAVVLTQRRRTSHSHQAVRSLTKLALVALEELAELQPVEPVATPTFAMQPRIVQLSPDRQLWSGLKAAREGRPVLPQRQVVLHPADIHRLG